MDTNIFDFGYCNLMGDIVISSGRRVTQSYDVTVPVSEFGRKVFTLAYDLNYFNGRYWVLYDRF